MKRKLGFFPSFLLNIACLKHSNLFKVKELELTSLKKRLIEIALKARSKKSFLMRLSKTKKLA